MNRIKNNKDFLNLLCKSKKKFRKFLIQNASKEQIYSICEIVLNILNGNLKVSDKNKLSKKRKLLRKIIQKSSLKKKRYLIQKGGFLEILIPSIVSGLASIISNIISE